MSQIEHNALVADVTYVGPHRKYNACLGCFEDIERERDLAWESYDELRKARDSELGRTISHTEEELQLRSAIFDAAVGMPPETKTSAWADRAQALSEAIDEYVEARIGNMRALTRRCEARSPSPNDPLHQQCALPAGHSGEHSRTGR